MQRSPRLPPGYNWGYSLFVGEVDEVGDGEVDLDVDEEGGDIDADYRRLHIVVPLADLPVVPVAFLKLDCSLIAVESANYVHEVQDCIFALPVGVFDAEFDHN
jgi:hypothetical protein